METSIATRNPAVVLTSVDMVRISQRFDRVSFRQQVDTGGYPDFLPPIVLRFSLKQQHLLLMPALHILNHRSLVVVSKRVHSSKLQLKNIGFMVNFIGLQANFRCFLVPELLRKSIFKIQLMRPLFLGETQLENRRGRTSPSPAPEQARICPMIQSRLHWMTPLMLFLGFLRWLFPGFHKRW